MTDRHRHRLRWTNPVENLKDLPPHIARHFVRTPRGNLEILSAQPSISPSPSSSLLRKKALIFQHGGFGCAAVWIPFLTFFSHHGFPCYAVSLRGHGASWKPGFFEMVYLTGKNAMVQDLAYAMAWVRGFEASLGNVEAEDFVLVGHSAGGGLVQYFLSREMGTVGGLVIVAGFPCFGGLGVYGNWFKLDPWFPLRFYMRDLWHPRSPLSSTFLIHRAFFSSSIPVEQIRAFAELMPEYESLAWPLGMMFPFVSVKRVLKNILGWSESQQRLLVIAGEKDTLMGVRLMRKMAAIYRYGFVHLMKNLSRGKKLGPDSDDGGHEKVLDGLVSRNGIRFAVIKHSGHHVQNDLEWEVCAKQILEFLDQM